MGTCDLCHTTSRVRYRLIRSLSLICCTCSTIGAGSAHRRPSAFTRTVCATARVSGRYRRERGFPCPVSSPLRRDRRAQRFQTGPRPFRRRDRRSESPCRRCENPGAKMNSISCASVGLGVGCRADLARRALSRTRDRSMPPPSSASSMAISLPCWRTFERDLARSRAWQRRCVRHATSMPWSSALRNRCSSGPTSFSSTERSSSTCVPRISRFARLSSSFAVCRRMR